MPLVRVIAALLLLAGLVACSSHAPGTLLHQADSGRLTIGIRFDQPGLAEHTLDGRFTGFDVDVAEYVAGALGVPPSGITWRETTSSTRETDLTSGTVDLVVATYSITDARKEVISFAGPYFETGQDLLVRRSDNTITGPETLNGRRLCSVAGSTPAQEVKARFAQAVELVEYPRYPDCVTALLAGQVDAITTDGVILAGYVTQNPELLKVVGKPFSTERYGIGLRKNDPDGQRALNDAIQRMISSGSWLDSLRTNLGPSGYPLPVPPAVTER
ncbi:glutamate ABC transporter substrate-binding protein [Amycolatopsis pithecellobii]|uniref:Transporter substrate-binding domain-containing protein n=1 Tax=Amycolatopsis pithecellobii TaxID=664692 RepID=A0A6N7Z7J1_9PSEU|nr:glutamate ABC transporter substrate-binding protein [Amycolatopsis pithecellobii]MTD57184.1 transporter substrate-binding domain-containing protein [Amycolatopsis pithecellobii]